MVNVPDLEGRHHFSLYNFKVQLMNTEAPHCKTLENRI